MNRPTPNRNSTPQPATITKPSSSWNLAMAAFPVDRGPILPRSPSAERVVALPPAPPVRYRAPVSIGTFTESFDRPVDPVDRLLRRRVILLSGPIDTERANDVMARPPYLEGEGG